MFVIELRYYIAHNNIILPSLIISIGVSVFLNTKFGTPRNALSIDSNPFNSQS